MSDLPPLPADLAALAAKAGIREERYMTNPPRPTGMAMSTAESLARFAELVARAAVAAERSRIARWAEHQGANDASVALMQFAAAIRREPT